VTGFPLHAVGALIDGAGGAEVAEAMAVVTGVIVTRMIGWEGNHPMASGPHGFDLEEDFLLIGVKCGGGGRDRAGGYCGFVLGGRGRAGFGQLANISVHVLEEFQHTELIHGDDEGTFDVVDDLGGSSAGKGERGHPGEEREETGVLEECLSEGIKGRANVEEGVDGEGKGFVSEVSADLLDIGGRGKVIMKAVGIEGNVDGVDAFPFSGKGERREDDFGRGRRMGRGFPTSVGFGGRGMGGFGDGGDSGGGRGGKDSRHVGGFVEWSSNGKRQWGGVSYIRRGWSSHVSGSAQEPRSLLRLSILSIGLGRSGKSKFRGVI
jgi:hypothetical protein